MKMLGLGLAAGMVTGILITYVVIHRLGPDRTDISHRFVSYISRIEGRSDLVLANKAVEEKFIREIRSGTPVARLLAALFGSEIGQATVELSCFVEYRYYVDLNSPAWSFDIDGSTLRVTPPALQLITPPGLHTQTIEARIRKRSIFIREQKHLDDMRTFLSDSLTAMGIRYTNQVQDTCAGRLRDILEGFSEEMGGMITRVELGPFGR